MGSVVLELAGHYAGKTIRLGHHDFVNGKIVIVGQPKDIDGAIRYLGRSYQAFPVGSAELKAAQTHYAAVKGPKDGVQRHTVEAGKSGHPNGVQGDGIQPPGTLPPSSTNDIGSDDSKRAADGSAGLVSGGSGHGDSGLLPEQVAKIRKALNELDPTVDSYWTDGGLPSVEIMSQVLDDPEMSRQTITVAWPEFNREKAAELREI